MALVRKGSRRIVVDGTVYRWRLRARPTYDQGLARSPCTFAVEHFGLEAEPVLPSDIAAMVRLALDAGWTPMVPGSAFHLDQSAGFTPSL